MQFNRFVLLAVLVVSGFSHGGGNDQGDSAATASFSDTLLAMDTLKGDFRQRIIDSDGEELQVTVGEFSIKRPGYFLWHVAPPYEQVVVGTPNALKVYDPDLEQMTVHGQDSLAGTPAALMSGDIAAIEKGYLVELEQSAKTESYFLRQNNEEEGAFESLVFVFSRKMKPKMLLEMSFTDKLGQKTEITVSNPKINDAIDESVFLFEPPKGTDIIVDG
ncbi:MAG: outer membrane lipoprotein chaperone LolA [Agarilytica sp.]